MSMKMDMRRMEMWRRNQKRRGVAVADQEGNEEIDQRGKGTGEMTEPAWLRHTHDHNHHTALNYVSLLSMSLIFRLLIFSTIVTLIFHLYLNITSLV